MSDVVQKELMPEEVTVENGNGKKEEPKVIVPEKKATQKKALAKAAPKKDPPVQSEGSRLLELAIQKDLDVDKLEKLIQLKNQEEERFCKKEFDAHFTAMKKALPVIRKEKEALNDSGGVMYVYAPIEALQKACDDIIAEHGFSYSWKEEPLEAGAKRIIFSLSGYGHEKENFFDAPTVPGTKRQNAIQVAATQTTFGRRYTFISGLGLTVEGDDNDARLTFADGVEYAEQITQLNSAKSLEDLKVVWSAVYRDLKKASDRNGNTILTKVYNKKKNELGGAE